MREMSYRIELDADNGYVLSIPDESPGRIEFDPIKCLRAKEKGSQVCHELIQTTIDDFIEPVTFNEDTDPALRKNYPKLFRNEWNDSWYITRISIEPRYISIDVSNEKFATGETFCVTPVTPEMHLKFIIKIPTLNGSIEMYIVEMNTWKTRSGYHHDLTVTEPASADGTKKIMFENGSLLEFHGENESWRYALVHETR